jgi:hypothetical protein
VDPAGVLAWPTNKITGLGHRSSHGDLQHHAKAPWTGRPRARPGTRTDPRTSLIAGPERATSMSAVGARGGSDSNVRAGVWCCWAVLRLICRPVLGAHPDTYRSGGVTY